MAAGCLKAILVILNILFFIVGLVSLALGVILKVGVGLITPYLQGPLASLSKLQTGVGLIDNQLSNAGNTANSTINSGASALDSLDFGPFLNSFIIALIVFGVFFILLSILAFCGGCCNVRIALIIYAVIVTLIFLSNLTLVILLYTGAVDGAIKGQLKSDITNNYAGIDGKSSVTLIWNFGMLQYKCCGVDNYTDFDGAKKWNNVRTFKINNVEVNKTMVTPIPCCKYNGTFPEVEPASDDCAFNPTPLNSNKDSGCFAKLQTEIRTMVKSPSVGAISVVLVIELAMAVLAILVVLTNKNKTDPV